MKATLKIAASGAMLAILSACGGGSDDKSPAPPASNRTELEGSWSYASAGHTSGSTCGRDAGGGPEARLTYIFEGSTMRIKAETCTIRSGNTGSFSETVTPPGTFATGNVYMTIGSDTYKTLDATFNNATSYSGYSLTGNKLKLARPTSASDGSTPAKRARGEGPEILLKQ